MRHAPDEPSSIFRASCSVLVRCLGGEGVREAMRGEWKAEGGGEVHVSHGNRAPS